MSRRKRSARQQASAARPETGAPAFRWRTLLPYAAAALTAAAVWGRTVSFDFSYMDDPELVIDRWDVLTAPGATLAAFREGYLASREQGEHYYRPLVTVSLVADALTYKAAAEPFHRTNVLLHVIASVLVVALARRLSFSPALAGAMGALFAAHPALAMAVAWIPGRNDLLLAVLTLAAWLAFLRYQRTGSKLAIAAHAALFLAAMLTKEAAIAVPAVLLLHRWLVDRAPARSLRDPLPWCVWAAALGVWAALRLPVVGLDQGHTLGSRAATAVVQLPGLLLHLGRLVVPVDLAPLAHRGDSVWWPGIIAALLCAAAAALAPRAARRTALFGLALFAVLLAPSLPVSDNLLLENRLYLPLVGILFTLGAAATHVDVARPLPLALATALVVAAGARAWVYSGALRDRDSFAEAAVKRSPHLALAQLTAGNARAERGDLDGAEQSFRECLRLEPHRLVIHNNLAVLAMRRDDLAAAEVEVRQELAINPTYDRAWYNLGLIVRQEGRPAEGLAAFSKAVELNPRNTGARLELSEPSPREGPGGRGRAGPAAAAANGASAP